jgi:predicted transcriptional regulator
MKDLSSKIKVSKVIAPISPAATGTISGTAVDLSGANSVTFIISAGAQTTAGITVTPTVVAGSATGSMSAVDDADLIGLESSATLNGTAGAASSKKIGYIGTARYASVNLAVTAAATGVYSVQCITEQSVAPQAQ